MLRVGLTGGIGSGKSLVASLFADLGTPVIDADQIARDVVQPGQEAHGELVSAFGREILCADGSLDRKLLRERVFAQPQERQRLEAIIHPRVRSAITTAVAKLDARYCVIVVPLLIESGMQDLVDRVLLVEAPEDVRVRRVMQRDHIDEKQVRQILAAQLDGKLRRDHADDILDNSTDPDSLRDAVARLHEYYQVLAGTTDSKRS